MGVLDEKAVVVTGSGRGLGRAYAIAAAREGALVVVNDIDGEEADAVAAEINAEGGRSITSHHSVAEPAAAQELIALCLDRFGRIDGLVNNAADLVHCDPWDVTPADIGLLVGANVLGTLYCGIAAMGPMRAQRSGVIINVTSGAHLGMPGLSLYGATKGAVTSLVYAWALELASSGVRVNGFSPRGRTTIGRRDATGGHAASPPEASGSPDPETVAPPVVFLLSSAARGLSGQVVRFDGSRLSMLTPPSFGEPKVEGVAWTVDAVAVAVDGSLRPALHAVGMTPVDLQAAEAGVGAPTR